jgi:cell pole-organizing protein PopZ
MSEARSANNDPSMDDILASIRKIISDDEARAQVGRQQAPNQSTHPTVAPSAGPQSDAAGRDDVLLLTDIIEEPGSGAADARPAPIPLPRIDPAQAAEMPQPSVEPPPGDAQVSDALVGSGVVGAASSAFARLNQAVQESVPQPAAHEPGPNIDGNGKTIEDLVKEMLRPMLKEWLDRNLPPMVERFVEREIVRLTRR